MSAELEARRTAAAAVLADFRHELATAPLSRPPGREWMFRLADVVGSLLEVEPEGDPDEDLDDGTEPYCTTCEARVGMFIGLEGCGMNGPFETEAEVRALPEVQAVYDAMHASTRRGVGDERCHRLLCDALGHAGVELGAYDHRIAVWLAGWEAQTVAVVAGWVERAHRPAPASAALDEAPIVLDALEVAAEYRRHRASLTCQACAEHPAELCEDHATDLDRADAYDTVGRQIGARVPAVTGEEGQRCCRCRIAPVHQPAARRADGYPLDSALYCAACIDRCHEATDFAHVCVICAGPDELASGLVPGAGAAWREAVRQVIASIDTTTEGDRL